MATIYVDENLNFGVFHNDVEPPKLVAGEILVEASFSGANPADVKHSTLLGIFPTHLGYDLCGKVIQTAPDSAFQVGEVVAGYTPTGLGRPSKYGAHQRYTICPEDMVFRVPKNLLQSDAACMSVVTMTAADALYNNFKFRLPQETATSQAFPYIADSSFGPLLIWGASSSVGICAVQLAAASGVYPILVAASSSRHELLKKLGATHCFDYRSATVVSDIKAMIQKYEEDGKAYIFDTVGTQDAVQLTASFMNEKSEIVSVEFQKDPRFRMACGIMNADVTMKPVHLPHTVTAPARLGDHLRAWSVLEWAVANYGKGFKFEVVEVFEGSAENALEELKNLAGHGRGFGKLVLKHPLL